MFILLGLGFSRHSRCFQRLKNNDLRAAVDKRTTGLVAKVLPYIRHFLVFPRALELGFVSAA